MCDSSAIGECRGGSASRRLAQVVIHTAAIRGTLARELVELPTCLEMSEVLGIDSEGVGRTLAHFRCSGVLRCTEGPRWYAFSAAQIYRLAFS
jgi:hypothetical protein